MLPTCARSVRASQGSEASFMQFGNSKFCRGNRSIFSICSGNTLLLLGWLCLVVALSGNLLSQSNANWITIHSSGSYYVTFGLWQKHTKPPAGNLYDLRKADFKDFVLNKKVYGEKAEEKQEVGTSTTWNYLIVCRLFILGAGVMTGFALLINSLHSCCGTFSRTRWRFFNDYFYSDTNWNPSISNISPGAESGGSRGRFNSMGLCSLALVAAASTFVAVIIWDTKINGMFATSFRAVYSKNNAMFEQGKLYALASGLINLFAALLFFLGSIQPQNSSESHSHLHVDTYKKVGSFSFATSGSFNNLNVSSVDPLGSKDMVKRRKSGSNSPVEETVGDGALSEPPMTTPQTTQGPVTDSLMKLRMNWTPC